MSTQSHVLTKQQNWCKIAFGANGGNPLTIAKNLYFDGKLASDIVVPDEITTIKPYAFYNYSGLKSITLPDSLVVIDSHAFYNCSNLGDIVIPDSVTTIGGGVFDGCHALKSVVMSKNVTNIGYRAFYACRGLTDIYYSGNETDWSKITISSSGNEVLSSATIHYNCSEKIALICS